MHSRERARCEHQQQELELHEQVHSEREQHGQECQNDNEKARGSRGNGVVVDPRVLMKEFAMLKEEGLSTNLLISDRAHLIMPYHVDIDYHLTNYQNELAAGSTRSGIAPVYADKLYRHGLRITDILNKDLFRNRLRKSFDFNKSLVEGVFKETFKHSFEDIFSEFYDYGQQLKPYIGNVTEVLSAAIKENEQIMFEGAQGACWMLITDFTRTQPVATQLLVRLKLVLGLELTVKRKLLELQRHT